MSDIVQLELELAAPRSASAPCLVLGHSLGTSAKLWAPVRPLLEKRYRVVTWELPGHGASPRAQRPFTIAGTADALVDRLRAHGIEDFYYAGVSIGGTVGLDLAIRHADRLRAVAVLAAGLNVDAPVAWGERAEAVRAAGTDQLAAGSAERWFAPQTRVERPAQVEAMLAALRATDDASYAWACEALAAYDAAPGASGITIPVLAVWGEHDRLVPESRSVELARAVRHGAVASVSGAAHAAPLEQPERVAGLLTSFLDQV